MRPVQLNVRLSEAEAEDVRAAAAACGLSVSEWARLVLGHATGRQELAEGLARAGTARPSSTALGRPSRAR